LVGAYLNTTVQFSRHARDDTSDTTADGNRVEHTRSEPADFGHGESSGVQEL
jgi:hypothetical protein